MRIWHPFNDENFSEQTLLPFKQRTKYDAADGYGLMVERLIKDCSNIGSVKEKDNKIIVSRGSKSPSVNDLVVQFEGESPQFYAYVPMINRAIKTLLEVMIQHTSVSEIRVLVSSEGPELCPTHCNVSIFDVGGRFEVEPYLKLLIKGESSRVLGGIRGGSPAIVVYLFFCSDLEVER